ncbi:MAG: PadR family transcriptional regulator [Fimbriimonadaceae bacterium]|nr:PadR family transcriptional regulator [Fimbriimonadaceae bacterium]
MSLSGPYSELEYLILAMVSEGINSGYAMRKQMTRMRGARWSAESGSVYRVLRRLLADGLVVEARKVGVPNRERTEYDLTPSGSALLDSWLLFPPDRQEFAFMVDPLRTRMYFLGRLKAADQIRIVKNWALENKVFLDELHRELSANEGEHPMRDLARLNLLYLVQARQDWLKKVLSALKTGAGNEVARAATSE